MDLEQAAIDAIQSQFADAFLGTGAHSGQRWAFVRRERVVEILHMLRDTLAFDMLMDLTAVDWLNQGQPERFQVVYQLYSLAHNQYFRLKTWVPESDPVVDTATGVWFAADWAEREVWDMFGISFRNHPDLKRILLPMDYPGHPLRKDYPVTGHGERYQFPKSET